MSLSKTGELPFQIHSFEFVGPDFFYHKSVQNLDALKKARIEHLKNQPALLQPILSELFRSLYKLYRIIFHTIFWVLCWIDGKFAEFADIK